ncbi:MAG: hypothetical protein HC828_20610 [Blastochloris sp.]|nr:hypothetical protein [Blastochloris sp.]
MQPETPPTLMHIFVNDFRLNQLMAMAALLTILGLMLAIFTTYRIVGAAAVVLGVAASVGIVLRMNSFQAVLDNAASTTGTITTMGARGSAAAAASATVSAIPTPTTAIPTQAAPWSA